MKKLLFIVAVSAAALMIAMPTGTQAQKIVYTPSSSLSVKIPVTPSVTSDGPVRMDTHVINPDINYNETKNMPPVNSERWSGHLKFWSQKRPLKREM